MRHEIFAAFLLTKEPAVLYLKYLVLGDKFQNNFYSGAGHDPRPSGRGCGTHVVSPDHLFSKGGV
jgi:hypothetical protein